MTDSDNPSEFERRGRHPGTASSRLLLGVQADTADAWHRLVTLYAPLVSFWCRQGGLQGSDADDVTQEVFRAVAMKVKEFRRDRVGDTFRGWLRQVTRNKLGDFYRQAGRHPKPLGGTFGHQHFASVAAEPSPCNETPETRSAEQRLLHQRTLELIRSEFETVTWQAFVMVVVNGMKPKDVADELGISVNSVYLAKSRVLRRARQELAEA